MESQLLGGKERTPVYPNLSLFISVLVTISGFNATLFSSPGLEAGSPSDCGRRVCPLKKLVPLQKLAEVGLWLMSQKIEHLLPGTAVPSYVASASHLTSLRTSFLHSDQDDDTSSASSQRARSQNK